MCCSRIRTRPQDHAVKQWADEPALQRIRRGAIGRTIERLVSGQDLTVLRLDTSTQSASSLADSSSPPKNGVSVVADQAAAATSLHAPSPTPP